MTFDVKAFVTQLLADVENAPAMLTAVSAMLDKLSTDAASVVPFLSKFFPSIATMDATAIADAKALVNFLLLWEPKVMPYVIGAINLLLSLLPATATAVPPGGTTLKLS